MRGSCSSLKNNPTWHLWPCEPVFRVKDRRKGLWILPLQVKEVMETRYTSGMSLHGGLYGPLSEAVKVKPGLGWKPQDAGNARVLGYLPRKATDREWNQTKTKKCTVVNNTEKSWRREEHFDTRYRDAESGVCQAGFGLASPSVSSLCALASLLEQ